MSAEHPEQASGPEPLPELPPLLKAWANFIESIDQALANRDRLSQKRKEPKSDDRLMTALPCNRAGALRIILGLGLSLFGLSFATSCETGITTESPTGPHLPPEDNRSSEEISNEMLAKTRLNQALIEAINSLGSQTEAPLDNLEATPNPNQTVTGSSTIELADLEVIGANYQALLEALGPRFAVHSTYLGQAQIERGPQSRDLLLSSIAVLEAEVQILARKLSDSSEPQPGDLTQEELIENGLPAYYTLQQGLVIKATKLLVLIQQNRSTDSDLLNQIEQRVNQTLVECFGQAPTENSLASLLSALRQVSEANYVELLDLHRGLNMATLNLESYCEDALGADGINLNELIFWGNHVKGCTPQVDLDKAALERLLLHVNYLCQASFPYDSEARAGLELEEAELHKETHGQIEQLFENRTSLLLGEINQVLSSCLGPTANINPPILREMLQNSRAELNLPSSVEDLKTFRNHLVNIVANWIYYYWKFLEPENGPLGNLDVQLSEEDLVTALYFQARRLAEKIINQTYVWRKPNVTFHTSLPEGANLNTASAHTDSPVHIGLANQLTFNENAEPIMRRAMLPGEALTQTQLAPASAFSRVVPSMLRVYKQNGQDEWSYRLYPAAIDPRTAHTNPYSREPRPTIKLHRGLNAELNDSFVWDSPREAIERLLGLNSNSYEVAWPEDTNYEYLGTYSFQTASGGIAEGVLFKRCILNKFQKLGINIYDPEAARSLAERIQEAIVNGEVQDQEALNNLFTDFIDLGQDKATQFITAISYDLNNLRSNKSLALLYQEDLASLHLLDDFKLTSIVKQPGQENWITSTGDVSIIEGETENEVLFQTSGPIFRLISRPGGVYSSSGQTLEQIVRRNLNETQDQPGTLQLTDALAMALSEHPNASFTHRVEAKQELVHSPNHPVQDAYFTVYTTVGELDSAGNLELESLGSQTLRLASAGSFPVFTTSNEPPQEVTINGEQYYVINQLREQTHQQIQGPIFDKLRELFPNIPIGERRGNGVELMLVKKSECDLVALKTDAGRTFERYINDLAICAAHALVIAAEFNTPFARVFAEMFDNLTIIATHIGMRNGAVGLNTVPYNYQ